MGEVDLTATVRRILIKNWIDMGRIRLQVAGKTVILRGEVRKSGEGHEPVNGLFIEELERQIQAAKGVRFVRWIIEGWKQEKGKWVEGAD
jgi:hypothetical protein